MARRRWVRIVEGILVLLLSPVGWLWAYLEIVILIPGAPPPVTYAPLWVLTGFAAVSGMVAITVGISPRGRLARLLFGGPEPG
jgi:hypothetical protein